MSGKQNLTGTKRGAGVAQRIVNQVPPLDVWLEPFWGRGSIARVIRRPAVVVGCDIDEAAIDDGVEFGARMFQTCGLAFLRDYFRGCHFPNSTFGGFPLSRHFAFIDPPYDGCQGKGYYRADLTTDEHVELAELFKSLPCPAILCGYKTKPLGQVLAGVRSVSYRAVNRQHNGRREWLWFNYDEPAALHDARFVGRNKRDREAVAKRVRRARARFARLKPHERQAEFEALAAVVEAFVAGCGGGSKAAGCGGDAKRQSRTRQSGGRGARR